MELFPYFFGFFCAGLFGLFGLLATGLLGAAGGDCGGLLALPAEGWKTIPVPLGFGTAPAPGGFGGGGPRLPLDTVPIGPISLVAAPEPRPARLLEPAMAAAAAARLTSDEELLLLLLEDTSGLDPKPTLLLDVPLEMMSPVMSVADESCEPAPPCLDLDLDVAPIDLPPPLDALPGGIDLSDTGLPFLGTGVFTGLPFLGAGVFAGLPFLGTGVFAARRLSISASRPARMLTSYAAHFSLLAALAASACFPSLVNARFLFA